jgi:hypothetical protein
MSAVPVRFFSFGWNSGLGKIQSPGILTLRKKTGLTGRSFNHTSCISRNWRSSTLNDNLREHCTMILRHVRNLDCDTARNLLVNFGDITVRISHYGRGA